MTALFFVDSNVFVYHRDSSDPVKQAIATSWLDRLWRNGTGRTSCQALNEFYVVATRKLGLHLSADDAWDDVTSLFRWDPLPVSAEVLTRSRHVQRLHRLSWWDSLIVAAAQLQNCGVLLTEDMQDGVRFGSVLVRSPFTLRVEEATPDYGKPLRRARHPPRGRPRKSAAPLAE
jgi:predicted nucleic acid-binding protein